MNKVMRKEAIAKVTARRKQSERADEYTLTTKGGKTFCFSITEDYILIHHTTDFKDITFSEMLQARINSYNIDASIYQLDLN